MENTKLEESVQLIFNIEKSMKIKLKVEAAKLNQDLSTYMRNLVNQHFDRLDGK
jgi:hypothetical protein